MVAYTAWPIKAKHADPLGKVAKCHHDDHDYHDVNGPLGQVAKCHHDDDHDDDHDDHDGHDVNDPLGQVAKSTSSGVAAVIRALARM